MIPGGGIPLVVIGRISPAGPCNNFLSKSVNFCLSMAHSCLDSFSSLSAALVASQFSCDFFSFAAICDLKSLSAFVISALRSSI